MKTEKNSVILTNLTMNNTVIYTAQCDNKQYSISQCQYTMPQLDSHNPLCHIYLKLVIALHTSLSATQYLQVNLS